MKTLSKEEILQAILDKKQLQEWDGIAEKFYDIHENKALSNIVHGKLTSMRVKPGFLSMAYVGSEPYTAIEREINRVENLDYKDRAMEVFFPRKGNQ